MSGLQIQAIEVYSTSGSADDMTVSYRTAGFDVTGFSSSLDAKWQDVAIAFGPEQVTVTAARDGTGLGRWFGIDLKPASAADISRTLRIRFAEVSASGVATSTKARVSQATLDKLPGTICTKSPHNAGREPGTPTYVRAAKNTVFALAGVIFVAEDPAQRAATWRDTLAPGEDVHSFYDSHQFPLGPHYLNWLSPREYKHYYGREWQPAPHEFGEIAALHLLCENLDDCAARIAAGGRSTKIIEHEHNALRTLWVPPDPRDGLAYHITQQDASEWLAARSALSGEPLEMARPPGD